MAWVTPQQQDETYRLNHFYVAPKTTYFQILPTTPPVHLSSKLAYILFKFGCGQLYMHKGWTTMMYSQECHPVNHYHWLPKGHAISQKSLALFSYPIWLSVMLRHKRWPDWGLNPGPPGHIPVALTNWAIRSYWVQVGRSDMLYCKLQVLIATASRHHIWLLCPSWTTI